MGLSVIMVTHDISVVAYVCDRTVVMYAGKVVEDAATGPLLSEPMHPYTMGLKNAFPDIKGAGAGTLVPIAGAPPDLADPPTGCRFAPRCPFAQPVCHITEPPILEIVPGHRVACHRADEAADLRLLATRPATWEETV
jgi:peptide/nickel transport system ATP-binding protein